MVESAWQCDFGQDGRKLWKDMLYEHDAELATKAVARLSKTMSQRPRIADLRQMIFHLRADERAKMPGIPEPKYGTEPPEWVWVWSFCRHMRSPRFYIPFPQQEPYVDPSETISRERFDELREEWLQAGSPKRTPWKQIQLQSV